MEVSKERLLKIRQYIEDNFIYEDKLCCCAAPRVLEAPTDANVLYDDLDNLKKRVKKNISSSWQEALFSIIDGRELDEVEVYKRAELTKQTFSKIRSNSSYHPDKDTAIRLCIGLQLNIDDTLDLLSKAGYTLSFSIERDLVIRYFIENNEYDIFEIDCVFEGMGMKQFLKY